MIELQYKDRSSWTRGTWTRTDELHFIYSLLTAHEYPAQINAKLCLTGYLKGLHRRRDWGPSIIEENVGEFRTLASELLRTL